MFACLLCHVLLCQVEALKPGDCGKAPTQCPGPSDLSGLRSCLELALWGSGVWLLLKVVLGMECGEVLDFSLLVGDSQLRLEYLSQDTKV